MEKRCHFAHRVFRAFHLNVGHTVGELLWHVLAQHGLGSKLQRLGYELVPVSLRAFHGHEKVSILDLARVDVYPRDFHIRATLNAERLDVL